MKRTVVVYSTPLRRGAEIEEESCRNSTYLK
jgi:hypothetical protein